MARFFTKEISNCGANDYFGYKLSDSETEKKLMKMSGVEISNLLNEYNDATQEFLKKDLRYA